jgi:hypothetical protein
MVCAREAQSELVTSLEAQPTLVTTPTWMDHVYSCKYMYPDGVIALSVKELKNAAATTLYFNSLANQFGRRPQGLAIGQGAFYTTNGSVIVRKDYKVLDIDVSQLPPRFGNLGLGPSDAALSVAATIMSCWRGA